MDERFDGEGRQMGAVFKKAAVILAWALSVFTLLVGVAYAIHTWVMPHVR